MIFRQLFDRQSCTYTYLLADGETKDAVLIDPVREQVDRDITLLGELGLKLRYTLETHIHADHVTSSGLLRDRLGSKSVVSSAGGANCASVQAGHGEVIRFGSLALEVRHTPGHTDGCVSYVLDDHSLVFTGDTLFIRGCGRTDFQQGDAARLYDSVHGQILSLPDDCIIYPGHDYKGRTCSTVREEKRFNPRLGGGRTKAEFIAIMESLDLANPAKIDVAVPANLKCGWLPEDGSRPEAVHDAGGWAPLVRSEAGVPEVTTAWTNANRKQVRVVDVRRSDEWASELRPIEGAELVTLDRLASTASDWSRQDRFIMVCRSGGRSGQAACLLESMGFECVVSMAGGMLEWQAEGLPTAG